MRPRYDYLSCAVSIGDQLIARAHADECGHLTWGRGFALDMSPVPDAGMFNGRCGEGWFLCALAKASGLDRFAAAGSDALTTLARDLESPTATRLLCARIGVGLTGIGSVIYACDQAGRYLKDEILRAAALNAATSLVGQDLEDVSFADFYWGLPALILALLSLGEGRETDALLQDVVARLLALRASEDRTGELLWRPRFGAVQAGFAHGITGVAHALVRASARLKSTEAYDAAKASFSFERLAYRPETNTWPDDPEQDDSRVVTGWCHGGIGIGLSRLGLMPYIRDTDIAAASEDIVRVAALLGTKPVSGPSNLCCGTLGQVDFLLRAGPLLDEALTVGAHTLGTRIAEAIMTRGYRSLYADESVPTASGLWQGLAGIGFTMLRLHAPDQFPSVLTFETY